MLNGAEVAEREQRYRNDEEHQRECHQQDFERQFVRRLLAGSRFHHGDHLVQEAGTRIGGNPHHQPVRKHGSASGNGGAVAASLADDRGRLARDGAFVHRRGTHDDLSVCGNLLFRPHEEQVLLLQGDRVHLFGLSEEEAGWVVHMTPLCHQALVELVRDHVALGGAQGVGLGLAPAFGERFREVREQDRAPQNDADGQREARRGVGDAEERQDEESQREYRRHVHHQHDRVFRLLARSKLPERIGHGARSLLARCSMFHSCHLSLTRPSTAPSSGARPQDPAQAPGTS